MTGLEPMELLFDRGGGRSVALPKALDRVYGALRFPTHPDRPHVVANFASTLDGVVALNGSGPSGGGEITGFDPHDRFLMGLLRAVADVVVIGAGTLRSVPNHRWTPERVNPAMSGEYLELRRQLGMPAHPLNVFVTSRGELDLEAPVFRTPGLPVLIVTTHEGARRLSSAERAPQVRVSAIRRSGRIPASSILRAIGARGGPRLVLVEGGPHLVGEFFAAGRLDELFLTVAPQVAGRDDGVGRLGLVEGRTFAPGHPLWGSLASVRRGGHHLFLRYSFRPTERPTSGTRLNSRGAPR